MAKNQKALRLRIRSVKNTAKITRTMSMVAASKMRKAQTLAQNGRVYLNHFEALVDKVWHDQKKDSKAHELVQLSSGKKILIILISSDRGLAGALNTNLFKEVQRVNAHNFENIEFIVIGKTAYNFVTRNKLVLLESFTGSEMATKGQGVLLTQKLKDLYLSGDYRRIYIASNEFVSTLKQIPMYTQVLPFKNRGDNRFSVDAIYEPNKKDILDSVIEHAIITRVYQSLLDADASEHSARMVAMQSATDNAKKLSEELTLEMNQARQDAITKELLDIASAAESVS